MVSLKHCAAVLLGLVAAGTAPGLAADTAAVTWSVMAKPDQDGKFQQCMANGAGSDGKTLAFVITRDGSLISLAVNPKWKFAEKSTHKVTFEIDGKTGGPLETTVVSEVALAYPLANSRSLMEAFANGRQFLLRIDGKSTGFSLKGADQALSGLRECWAEGIKSLQAPK